MSTVLIIPWGRTDWTDQQRLIGRTDLPLNEAGRNDVAALAESLAAAPPDGVHTAPEEAARETAKLLARSLKLRAARPIKDLHELDLGLWVGLTASAAEQRFSRAFEQWKGDPASCRPPSGELFEQAMERLVRTVDRWAQRHPEGQAAFIVGPMAAAILRCKAEGGAFTSFWKYVTEPEPMVRLPWAKQEAMAANVSEQTSAPSPGTVEP